MGLQTFIKGGGEILAVLPPATTAIPQAEVDKWIELALTEARTKNIRGKAVTPFLLGCLANLSDGRTLKANTALIEHNAEVAASLAIALTDHPSN